MELRTCGNSGLRLSALGLGCWAFGGGDYWGPTSQADADSVVRFALDAGCNYFDTAEVYNDGLSEASLGRAIQGLPRDKVVIGTKVSPNNTDPATLAEHCEASLRRLRSDYIDLYMVHWPITRRGIVHYTTQPIPVPSTPDAFAMLMHLQKQGKIRHIGVSNFARNKLDEALATGATIAANQLPYSLLKRGIEADILPYCQQKGIAVVGYMSMFQGILAGGYRTADAIPEAYRRTRHFDSRRNPQSRHHLPGAEAETMAALDSIRLIAQSHGMSMAQIAMKWAMVGIACSLCGSRTIAKLKENLDAAATPLAPEIVAELNRATQPLLDALGPSFDYWEHPDNDRTR